MNNKRNLILSIVKGYDFPFIEPFVKSLRRTDYNGELVLFTDEKISSFTKFFLKKYGAKLIFFNSKFPFITDYADAFKNINESVSINNYRFVLFLNFIEQNRHNYDNVMITDVRDVVFQHNPFSKISPNKLYFFLEDDQQTFERSELNFLWYKEVYGENAAKNILNCVVSCAGITIGSVSKVIEYLKYIKGNLESSKSLEWGIDQGIHNGFIYHEDFSDFTLVSNKDPIVYTLGAVASFHLNDELLLVNDEGKEYSIIHQYDRKTDLFLSVKRKYNGTRVWQLFKRAAFYVMP